MPGHERKALVTRAPVTDCPACRDNGKRLRFFTALSWEPETTCGVDVAGPPNVACNEGHRFQCQSWTVGEHGAEYVLTKRL